MASNALVCVCVCVYVCSLPPILPPFPPLSLGVNVRVRARGCLVQQWSEVEASNVYVCACLCMRARLVQIWSGRGIKRGVCVCARSSVGVSERVSVRERVARCPAKSVSPSLSPFLLPASLPACLPLSCLEPCEPSLSDVASNRPNVARAHCQAADQGLALFVSRCHRILRC